MGVPQNQQQKQESTMKKSLLTAALALALPLSFAATATDAVPAQSRATPENTTIIHADGTSHPATQAHDHDRDRAPDIDGDGDADPVAAAAADAVDAVVDGLDANNDGVIDRPDAWILTKVKAQMALSPTIEANDINVDVASGMVTLRGTVDTAAERQEAIRVAATTEGVRGVNASLALVNDDGATAGTTTADRPDSWLLTKVKAQMAASELVEANDINVDVQQGVVSLKGTVGSQAERQEAIRLAATTEGVRGVQAQLKIQAN